jgi:hypothetical protein
MELAIPGFGRLRLEHLVLDYNGTLAVDGRPLPGVKTRLKRLARSLRIHVITADTFGKARSSLSGQMTGSCSAFSCGRAGWSRRCALELRLFPPKSAI